MEEEFHFLSMLRITLQQVVAGKLRSWILYTKNIIHAYICRVHRNHTACHERSLTVSTFDSEPHEYCSLATITAIELVGFSR